MKILKKSFNGILFALLLLSVTVNAQKPAKQLNSLLAPANIKIDGKLTEWGEKFQAYNEVNRVFYTISNDADNLYLTIRLTDNGAIIKAFYGGITFSVSPVTKSKEKVAITYPAVSGFQNLDYETIRGSHFRYATLKKDGASADKLIEMVKLTNKQISSYFKQIQVAGIKEITDPLIPIYNTEDIKTVAAFNDQMEYIYELAVPLKFIKPFITDNKLKYNIKLNARPTIKNAPPSFTYTGNDLEILYQTSPSDFSDEYTLAK